MAVSVKLEIFEGPLDLLLHLLDKNKVSIYDIPIANITEQYMEYIHEMQQQVPDMEQMSDFLVMAATLLDIKSRMLLPVYKEEEEINDPREELTNRLLEYRIYRNRANLLKEMDEGEKKSLYQEISHIPEQLLEKTTIPDMEQLLDGVTMRKLQTIFHMVMKRQIDRMDPVRSQFGKIEKEKISMADKMVALVHFGREHQKFSFTNLLNHQEGKEGIIVTFLACLELIRMGNLKVLQEETCSDIQMEWQEQKEIQWNEESWRAYS